MHKDEIAKKTIRIVPLKESGEPAVISIPISQAKYFLSHNSSISCGGICFSRYVM